jgi:hypothetical protein
LSAATAAPTPSGTWGGGAELAADDIAQGFHRGIRQHGPVVVRSIGGARPHNPDWQTGSEAGHGGADRRIGEGDATRKHVAQRGAAPLGGDDIGDIDAILAEQVLLQGNDPGHADHHLTEVGKMDFRGRGARIPEHCRTEHREYTSHHCLP